MQIKFKGKRVDNGEWVHGYCFSEIRDSCPTERHFMRVQEVYSGGTKAYWVEVDPKTVGQYTTLNDKKREEAYTGDILDTPVGKAVIRFGGYSIGSQRFHIGFYLQFEEEEAADVYRKDIGYWLLKSVIIGNIHDQEQLQCKPSDEGKV